MCVSASLSQRFFTFWYNVVSPFYSYSTFTSLSYLLILFAWGVLMYTTLLPKKKGRKEERKIAMFVSVLPMLAESLVSKTEM